MNSSDDQYNERIVVASIDLLGIRNILKRPSGSKDAITQLEYFWKNAALKPLYNNESCKSYDIMLYKHGWYFGDTIYLFGSQNDSIADQVWKLVVKCASIIAVGFYRNNKFLARAGISVGDLRVKSISTPNGRHELRIGTSMANAQKLESIQDWVGGALDSDIPDIESEYIIDYPVPLKPSTKAVYPIAINWVELAKQFFSDRNQLVSKVSECHRWIGGAGENEERKIKNTIDFISAVW
ncbi:MAG: hypothetical protein GTO45_01555 [Candidatus Aminicenantes bacterium]|nr:hypothetical protein [Candidatus Aminicenantes bacterium]NIM77448.1 hypothetical protein [Candidatus Aminicenantes bacterium]NIN16752.1 hypothetical protein [Candidatus Aminicenantes bacterium]NIN40608.1 hypothetical protein [Candidatus Aminicenantes bacterium]NIN83429.1 hypothetical protein [Candidatus Aminicenantes bacterium]